MPQNKNISRLISFLLLISSFGLYSQDRSIEGKVFDFSTDTPMPLVNVLLYDTDTTKVFKGSITRDDGAFIFENLSEDSYTIKLLFIGYTSVKKNIEFTSGNQVDLGNIYMKESAQYLQNIEVVVEKSTIEQTGNKTVLNINEGLSQSSSVSELLENIPSVNVDDSGISIQGQKPILLIDGIESSSDEFNSLSPQIISSIEVQTNASAKYSGSKIINVKLKSKGVKQKDLKLSALAGNDDFYKVQISGNYRKNKFNFGAGGFIQNQNNYKDQELVRTFDLKDQVLYQDKQDSTNVKKRRIFANAAYKLNKKNALILRAFMVNNKQKPNVYLNNQYVSSFPRENNSINNNSFDQHINNVIAIWRKKSDRTGNFEWTNQYQNRNYLRDNNSSTYDLNDNPLWQSKSNSDENMKFVLSRLDYDKELGKHLNLEAGISFKYTDNSMASQVEKFNPGSGAWEINPSRSYTYNYIENRLSSYLSLSYKKKKISTNLGVRIENIEWISSIEEIDSSYVNKSFIPSPILDIHYKINERQQLSFGLSRRMVMPNYQNLNPHANYSNPDFIRSGNPFLKLPTIWNFELIHNLNSKILNNKTSLFFRQENDKIARIISETEVDDVLLSKPENIAESNSFGIDLTQKYKISKGFSMNTYLIAYHYQMKGENLDPRAKNKGLTGSARIALAYKTSFKLRANINYNYKGRSYIPNGEISDYSFVDIGLSQSFLKNKLSLSLRARDIFKQRKSFYQTYSNATYNEFYRWYNSRSIIMGVVYKM